MPLIECIECGKERIETPSRIKQGNGKYCSRECFYVAYKRNPPSRGAVRSLETRAKIRLAHIGKKHPFKERPNMKGRWLGERNPRYKHGESGTIQYHAKMNKVNRKKWLIKKAGRDMPDHCEICLISTQYLKRELCYDHDHKTDKFRGWICNHCNSALGMIRDNIDIAERIVQYLKANSL